MAKYFAEVQFEVVVVQRGTFQIPVYESGDALDVVRAAYEAAQNHVSEMRTSPDLRIESVSSRHEVSAIVGTDEYGEPDPSTRSQNDGWEARLQEKEQCARQKSKNRSTSGSLG